MTTHDDETPRPPATPEFGAVTPDGPSHPYPRTGRARVTKFSVGQYDNNVYVVCDRESREAIVVDGSAGPVRVLPELEGFTPVGIVITHGHFDHVMGVEALAGSLDVPVYAHAADAAQVPVPTQPIAEGDEVRVGALTLRVLHTPGHTPGAVCLLIDDHLFAGDTLFPAGPGNTFGNRTAFEEIMRSLDRLFAELPDGTRVSPGHGLDTTIGRERPYVDVWRRRGW